MKKIILAIAAMIMSVGSASAQNGLYVEDVTVAQGTTEAVLHVSMINDVTVQSVGGSITLPEGVSIQTQEIRGVTSYVAELTGDRPYMHTLTVGHPTSYGETYYRYAILQGGYPFEGSEGEIFTITVDIDPEIAVGEYEIKIAEVEFSNADGIAFNNGESTAKFIVTSATGIEGVSEAVEESAADSKMYSISGVQISSPVKGQIYIKNGKKVVAE